MGNQRKTLHARKPLRTSSTHSSSNVIHVGRCLSSIIDGFTSFQKPGFLQFRRLHHVSNCSMISPRKTYSVKGFHDQRLAMANLNILNAFANTDPDGGVKLYFFLQLHKIIGQMADICQSIFWKEGV